MRLLSTVPLSLLLSRHTLAAGVGYNSECRMDSECRAQSSLPDICCAQLIYQSNGVEVRERTCLAKSTMQDAKGAYQIDGVTTTRAYCDQATYLTIAAGTVAVTTLFLLSN